MSTPILPEYSAPYKPVPQITPFTYRDGVTMLKKLELLKRYINKELVPFVNDNYSDLADAFEEQVNILIQQVNAAIDSIINNSIEVQDPVVAALLEDPDSATKIALNDILAGYAPISLVGTVADLDTAIDGINAQITAIDTRIDAVDTRIDGVEANINNLDPADIGAVATRVHVVLAMGQSNMQGHGLPTSLTLDPINPRIFEYGAHSHLIEPASEPLDMPDNNITGNGPTGIGPALQFARHMLADLPEEDVIVIVPAAVGSSALIGTGVNDWQWGGNATNLSTQAVDLTQDAIAAAEIMFPKADVAVAAFLWHQGERDGTNNVTMTNYLNALSDLINGFRGVFGNAPFIIGQMVPFTMTEGTRRQINEAHSRAPYVLDRVGFATAEPNMFDPANNVHFNGPGQRKLAKEYYREYLRVVGKLAPENPIMPVSGTVPVNQDNWIMQSGEVAFTATGTDEQLITVVFPKPFASVPFAMAQGHLTGTGIYVYAFAGTATSTQVVIRCRATASGGTNQTIKWVAFGPKYEGN